MILKAYAKINLTLEVLKKLESGYHLISSVMQQVALYDTIFLEKSNEVKVKCKYVKEKENLVYKVVLFIKELFGINSGVKIEIEKNIPVGGGLGGGSADCAAVILGLNKLFKLNLNINDLIKIGAEMGKDVPFSLVGGCCVVSGVGEILKKIEGVRLHVLMIYPGFSISTREAYEKLNLKINKKSKIPKITAKMVEAIKKQDVKDIAKLLFNEFEHNVIKEYPVIGKIKKELIALGALNACISGTGATVYGIFDSNERARYAYDKIKDSYPWSYLTETIK